MKSIKYKILLSFCLTALVGIVVLGGIISWQLDESLSQQSTQLAAEMTIQTYKNLTYPP
jgi:hypothetical protein